MDGALGGEIDALMTAEDNGGDLGIAGEVIESVPGDVTDLVNVPVNAAEGNRNEEVPDPVPEGGGNLHLCQFHLYVTNVVSLRDK